MPQQQAQLYDEHAELEEDIVNHVQQEKLVIKNSVVKKAPFGTVGERDHTNLDVDAQGSSALQTTNMNASNVTQLGHLNDLCSLLKIQSAPNVDMDYFDGNPLDYQYFKSLFKELIDKKIDDPLGKLARLIKYTRGEPKELIQHCIQMPQPDGYVMAQELLEKEYGDPHKVSSAYMKELRSWKPINAGDVNELKRYYRFLLKCNTNRKGDVYLKLLDNPETLRILQSKLPYKMRERWTRRAVQQRETEKGELVFADFVELVRMECKFLDDPVYSVLPDSVERSKSEDRSRKKFGGNEKIFASQVNEEEQVTLHAACLYCADRHDIDSCQKFIQLAHREKREYLFKQKICFHCYEVFTFSSDHGYNKCKNKRFCGICKDPHPTAMHRDQEKKEHAEEAIESARTTHMDDDQTDSIGMPIIPVRLYASGNPKRSVIVYAMLDVCSTGTFILQETVDQLNEEAEGATVNIRTVIGMKRSRKNYIKKDKLVIESVSNSVNSKPIKLPKCYCEESLPVEHDEIITIGGLKKWSYLREGIEN